MFKNNHYSGSLLDPENWWCILAQFEKFEQIWGTVKGRTLKLKKRFENSICFAFHLSTYLLLYVPYMQNFKKNACLRSCWWCKIGVKWSICPNQQQGPLLEISYIPLLSVMTLHYHRLYQTSSLEDNFSSKDTKQLCRYTEATFTGLTHYIPQN